MLDSVLSVHFITAENIAEFEGRKEDIEPSVTGASVDIEIGKVVITRTILAEDLFNPSFGYMVEANYLATMDEFTAKFDIIDDHNRTATFALITQKK